MAKPVPDEVLRKIVEYAGEDRYHPQAELARELLALRAAARVADNVLLGVELGEVVGEKAAMRARADLRALLPEEPPRA